MSQIHGSRREVGGVIESMLSSGGPCVKTRSLVVRGAESSGSPSSKEASFVRRDTPL